MDFSFLPKRVLSHSNKNQTSHEAQSIHFGLPGIRARKVPIFFNAASLQEASLNGSKWDTYQKVHLRTEGLRIEIESKLRTFQLWINLEDGSQVTCDWTAPKSLSDPGCTTVSYGKFHKHEVSRILKFIQKES